MNREDLDNIIKFPKKPLATYLEEFDALILEIDSRIDQLQVLRTDVEIAVVAVKIAAEQ